MMTIILTIQQRSIELDFLVKARREGTSIEQNQKLAQQQVDSLFYIYKELTKEVRKKLRKKKKKKISHLSLNF